MHPGEQTLELLKSELGALDSILSIRSDSGYTLILEGDDAENDEGETSKSAVYAYLAIPDAVAVDRVADVLETVLRDAQQPLVWTTLAIAAGRQDLAEHQAQLAERYGLDA